LDPPLFPFELSHSGISFRLRPLGPPAFVFVADFLAFIVFFCSHLNSRVFLSQYAVCSVLEFTSSHWTRLLFFDYTSRPFLLFPSGHFFCFPSSLDFFVRISRLMSCRLPSPTRILAGMLSTSSFAILPPKSFAVSCAPSFLILTLSHLRSHFACHPSLVLLYLQKTVYLSPTTVSVLFMHKGRGCAFSTTRDFFSDTTSCLLARLGKLHRICWNRLFLPIFFYGSTSNIVFRCETLVNIGL